ncbi:MAG TPA: hypothetical protein VFG56_01150 [Candidatus Saccharimonadales bacterium]|nr:hypothetical protein [Candidatus Saccharimonadales bacterium]
METLKLSDKELIDELVRFIGPTLTAFTAHSTVRAEFVLDEWRNGTGVLHPGKRERLEVAYKLLNDVAEADGEDTARAWFIGANSGSNRISPAESIRRGEFTDAKASARSLIRDEWL